MFFARWRRAGVPAVVSEEPTVQVTSEAITIVYQEGSLPVRHVLSDMQMGVLRRAMRRHKLLYTLENMRRIVEQSPFTQLCFLPRSPEFARWSFEKGIKAYFEEQLESFERQFAEEQTDAGA